MNTLRGKGFFIWQIPNCEKGDSQAIAHLAHEARLTHVLIKIADSSYSYNIYEGVDLVPPLVRKLHERGIEAWGWHFVRGDNPIGEANKAIERVTTLGLDGYVIDAEGPYKQRGKSVAAKKFMMRLREGLSGVPIGLSSYRYPSYHPQLPWREFLEGCDFNMPQVYWKFAHNPGEQLSRCVREFQALTPSRPIIPTGAAFKEHGWNPSGDEILDFIEAARKLNLPAVNFYSWDSCRARLPEIWKIARDFDWDAPPSPPDITMQYIDALNSGDPDQLVKLYNPNAVHITAARTVQGIKSLRIWYQTLFSSILPNAKFTLTSYSGRNNSRHLSWTATSDMGAVHNGNDTFGIYEGKITYHYSFFTINHEVAA
jgi:hypothetical protein